LARDHRGAQLARYPLRIDLVVRRFGVGHLVFEFHVQHPLDRVQCGVDGGEVGVAVGIHECSHDRRGISRRLAAVRNEGV
jgi:hypothetical protein